MGGENRHILLNQLVAELGNPHTGEKTLSCGHSFSTAGSTGLSGVGDARVLGERIDEICQERGLSEEESPECQRLSGHQRSAPPLLSSCGPQGHRRLLLKIPDFDRREAVTAAVQRAQKRWYDTHVIDGG